MDIQILQSGRNEAIIKEAFSKAKTWMTEILGEDRVIEVDDLISFDFGTVTVQVQVVPWHSEDALVKVFSYIVDCESIEPDLALKLLRLNAGIPLGTFGVTFDNTIIFSYSLAAKDMDKGEFSAAIQSVAVYADQYDEIIKEYLDK